MTCSVTNRGRGGEYKTLNTDEVDTLKFRFEFPVKSLCEDHFHQQFVLFPLKQKKCCDPCLRHSKPVKLRLSEISLELAHEVNKSTEHRVSPGEKLCRTCTAYLSELISSYEESVVDKMQQQDNKHDDSAATEYDSPGFDLPEFDSPM